MAWAAVAGAVVGVVGNVIGGSTDAKNAAKAKQDDWKMKRWEAEVNRQDNQWNAELQREQYGTEVWNRERQTEHATNTSMYDRKYGIADQQGKYDAFEKEFGSVQDNVNNYFRTLSAASAKGKNNDDINGRIEGVNARITQTMSERGINPSSGVAIQALASNQMAGEMEKVQANRNVETEIAGAQSEFLSAQANNPLLARAQEFDAGMLTNEQTKGFNSDIEIKDTYEIPDMMPIDGTPKVSKPSTIF